MVYVAPTEPEAAKELPAPTAAQVGTWLPVAGEQRTAVALSADCLGSPDEPRELIVDRKPAAGKAFEVVIAQIDDHCEEAATPQRLGLSRDPKGTATRHCTGWLLSACGANYPQLAMPKELSPQIFLAAWEWENALRSLRETADGLGESRPDPKRLSTSLGDGIRVAYPPGATVFTFGRKDSVRIERQVRLLVELGSRYHAVVFGKEGLLSVLTLKEGSAEEVLSRRVPRFVDRSEIFEEDPRTLN